MLTQTHCIATSTRRSPASTSSHKSSPNVTCRYTAMIIALTVRFKLVIFLTFIAAKDDGDGGENWSYNFQSNHHHQQTSTLLFTGQTTFLSSNQQCQSTGGKQHHIPRSFSPLADLQGSPNLSFTTTSSCLLWERVVRPFVSPKIPTPEHNKMGKTTAFVRATRSEKKQ